jgi:hypothetical protein
MLEELTPKRKIEPGAKFSTACPQNGLSPLVHTESQLLSFLLLTSLREIVRNYQDF